MNAWAILRPPPERTPDEWANANRRLSAGAAEGGGSHYRSERTPYTLEPQRAAIDSRYRRVVLVVASQTGKTSALFNIIGRRLDDDPAPVLLIEPTRSLLSAVIEPKIDQMLRECPELWRKTAKGKRYSRFVKTISGVPLRLAWAGSAVELRGDAACDVLVDEVDGIDRDIKGEGGIIPLADARRSTYGSRGKTIATSSPTEGNIDTLIDEHGLERWQVSDEVASPIWKLWQRGTRHEWAWPCPHCSEYFIPRRKLLWWPEGSTPAEAERAARLTCPRCGELIAPVHRDAMNARGIYLAPGQWADAEGVHGEPPDVTDATYWCSGLATFSLEKTWGVLASEYLQAAESGDPSDLKGVVNTAFGECFWFSGEAPRWEQVASRKADYSTGDVPAEVAMLTCGVDVGARDLHYAVRGWRWRNGRLWSWLIEPGRISGDTRDQSESGPWAELGQLLDEEWGERKIQIEYMGIDVGWRPDEVGAFVLTHRGRCFATRGRDHMDVPYKAFAADVTIKGRLRPKGIHWYTFDTDRVKSWLHARIECIDEVPDWRIPGDTDPEYYRHLCAESRVPKPDGRATWQKQGANHWLDCEAINRLLVIMKRSAVKKHSKRLPIVLEPAADPAASPPPAEPIIDRPRVRAIPFHRHRRRPARGAVW